VLRRAGSAKMESKIIRVADLEIDLDTYTVKQASKTIDLTRTEFSILSTLAASPGRVFNRLQLLEATQGNAYEGYERTIDAHIKNLRKKLSNEKEAPAYIETVFGIGYRFSPE
jgi:DNA-binding response OmpR family regulator